MRSILHLAVRGVQDMRAPAYPVEREFQPDGRGPYPLDLSSAGLRFRPNREGVIMVPGPDGCDFYNPVSASLFALATYNRTHRLWPIHGPGLTAFLAQASYLRRSQDSEGGWQYPIPIRRYGLRPGWYSAMAQGLAISVMLRSYDITGEESFLDAAEAARILMLRPIESGGCSDYDDFGRPFLEECQCDARCHILNGALCALIGLCELEARLGERVHVSAAQRLAGELGKYDLGYWSRYDLRFAAPATLAYHSLHISLLGVSARLFSDPAFGVTAARWRSYARHPGYRLRAAAAKARFVLGEGNA
jgi:D-glucuronyl C5-epimerase C-terminus